MLKTILSVSGKPGLFKMVSQGKNMLIVESLTDKKRIPAYSRDKVISLGDIAIYTSGEDVPLYQIFNGIKAKEADKPVPVDTAKATPDELRAYLAEILPEFDRERVYPTDIKRLLNWYNLLLAAGITDYDPEKEETAEPEKGETVKDEPKKAVKPSKTAAAKDITAPKRTATTKTKQPVAKTTQRTRQK